MRGVGDNSSPALITLGTSHASITARISGVEKQTSGQHLAGLVGGDYRAISEYESESETLWDGPRMNDIDMAK